MENQLSNYIYPLDKSVNPQCYIPEPGYDDGPEPTKEEKIRWSNCKEHLDPWEVTPQVSPADQGIFPYLDIYAQRGGALPLGEYESELNEDFDYEEWKKTASQEERKRKISEELSRSVYCGYTAAVFENEYQEVYYHNLDCRKHWCPICGGKEGTIHKNRKHAIFDRVDVRKFNLRQLVFTIPQEHREYFKSRYALNQALCSAKNLCKKYFGKESAMIGTLHLFGDSTTENPDNDLTYHPHVNVQIIEAKNVRLKLESETLDKIRESWRRSLIGMGLTGIKVVNFDYEFKIKLKSKFHAMKYFCRPTWGAKQIEKTEDEELKELLVLGLKGFQYIRFWGALSNCKYEESGMMTKREKAEIEKVIGERLYLRRIETGVNFEKMIQNGILEEIRPNFYRLKSRKSSLETG